MLRIIQNISTAGAKSYYTTADYYTQGQELQGRWRGTLAPRLGLSGSIDKADWDALCDNRDPHSVPPGSKLTPRDKSLRRVGYDLNFHAPKSLSLLFGLTQDERLLTAFQDAVYTTMTELERDMQVRVRIHGQNQDRTTGSMLWGEFTHFTARPVAGHPDPHLHSHCFAFNLTYDQHEQRLKAGQFGAIKRDAPYYEAVFHAHLARAMEELGLSVERTRTGWEVIGVPKAALDKFSRRTAQVEAVAKALGIKSPEDKDRLGSTTRERKAKDLTMGQLREVWHERLSSDEADALQRLRDRIGSPAIAELPHAAREAVRHAIEHCFERSAVVPERTVLARALKHAVGKASSEQVHAAFAQEPLVRRTREGRVLVTTKDVLAEEQRMLDFARAGRGACRPLGLPSHVFQHPTLSPDQKKAVLHVLTSKDRIIVVRGVAGTGKTTMMREAVAGIEAGPSGEPWNNGEPRSGKQVFTFAPSAGASRGVLRNEGFETADTVARLLVDRELQENCRDQVLWIDEAGLLGSKTTAQLFDLAKELHARVILSGDRRQHASVERGGVLRLLETEAGVAPVELKDIKRQSGQYKSAVEDLSEGRVADAFDKLHQLGWINEVPDDERYLAIAKAYAESSLLPGDTLVVSPTHAEANRITAEIRSALKASGTLSSDEHIIATFRPTNLTEAERSDPLAFEPGDVLVFHQNARGGIKRGTHITVGNNPRTLPLTQAKRFTVYRPSTLTLAPGDRVRVTKNLPAIGRSPRLNNGDLHTVKSIAKGGTVTLDNHATLKPDATFLDYGYCTTSHASQGKSVQRVLIGQSSLSFPASSKEQFYVSVSRGKKQALIFTDDRKALLDAVSHGDERLTATDLAFNRAPAPQRDEHAKHNHRTPGRNALNARARASTNARIDRRPPAIFNLPPHHEPPPPPPPPPARVLEHEGAYLER